ncbi:hypothetical protein SEVIR_6G026050v4 [Setaria viridis]|uniref:Uncharacterized protein n=1 Tax=Setaria viridis TaxID=4556 RepID=A0A4U6TZC3_SETVI|nr:hypothetical protein SEVIR_6G026050v2 [Setaria viridis]
MECPAPRVVLPRRLGGNVRRRHQLPPNPSLEGCRHGRSWPGHPPLSSLIPLPLPQSLSYLSSMVAKGALRCRRGPPPASLQGVGLLVVAILVIKRRNVLHCF